MVAPAIHRSAAKMYRTTEGLGPWPHRGKVAAVGIGHSPTLRRWDGDPQTTVGAWTILAIRRAIEDAGVTPDQVDGLVLDLETSVDSVWPNDEPVPSDFLEAFAGTDNPLDGLARLSPEWLLKNMPELSNVKFVMIASDCMSMVLTVAIEAVARGLATNCVAVRGWHNFKGRYLQGNAYELDTVSGPAKYGYALAGPGSFATAMQFQRYMHKYNKTHDMMAPFVVNSRANGLLLPEGYWAQHSPDPITVDDYLSARWIAKPANLLDNDIPIHTAAAYLITSSERAKDMAQKPVYVLGHAGAGLVNGDAYENLRPRSLIETLEEAEENAASTARKLYEAASIGPVDVQFENAFDGFSLFHVFHMEAFGFAGIKRGEGLDLFQSDISIHGPNPVSPSGGNIGGGRTRFWGHTDSLQQIQGRAGLRAMTGIGEVRCGISGGPTTFSSNFIVWSSSPD